MQYRNFGQLDFKPSALGFGAMRLPTIDGNEGQIDEAKAIAMIRYAIDQGVNYIDTAWPYHSQQSEPLVAKALKDGYREKVKLATKLPSWELKEAADMDKFLEQQLARLETDSIDFYLLHSLNQKYWDTYLKFDVFSWIEKVKAQGKIKHIGFSFHDDYDLFQEIIDAYEHWDFCQIQYNYLDVDFQAGKKGLKYAAAKGLGVIIMEPLRGGRLAQEQPPAIQKIWDNSGINRTPADWALQWLWNQKEVSLVLSGMSTMEQVRENILSACKSGINSLSPEELAVIEQVKAKYEELAPINCTGCGYCLPCPNGVAIPDNFKYYNEAHIYEKYQETKDFYLNKWSEKSRASSCVSCGACESVCPQHLEIISLLQEVHNYFTA